MAQEANGKENNNDDNTSEEDEEDFYNDPEERDFSFQKQEHRAAMNHQHFSCSLMQWMPSMSSNLNNIDKKVNGNGEIPTGNFDEYPNQEARCLKFEMETKPIMTSCHRRRKNNVDTPAKVVVDEHGNKKETMMKKKNDEPLVPPFTDIWQSKMVCSAQYEESLL